MLLTPFHQFFFGFAFTHLLENLGDEIKDLGSTWRRVVFERLEFPDEVFIFVLLSFFD